MNTVINEERLNKRLAYLSVNHKAKLLNRILRRLYPDTQDLSDTTLSLLVSEYDKQTKDSIKYLVWRVINKGYGVQDIRRVTDWMPTQGLLINPMKIEGEIDGLIKYHAGKLITRKLNKGG